MMREKTIVRLKEALITGIVLDFILLLISGTIMDGGDMMMRTFFLVVSHLISSIWLVLRYKDNLGTYGRDFIRFGIFVLIAIAAVVRLTILFFGVPRSVDDVLRIHKGIVILSAAEGSVEKGSSD